MLENINWILFVDLINKPLCINSDPTAKPGVNCVNKDDVESALHLLNVLKPELTKRSVANKCFDMKIKAHMSEDEIILHVVKNFAIKVNCAMQFLCLGR